MNLNLTLKAEDFAKGAATAVIAAVIAVIYNLSITNGFNVASIDWASTLSMVGSAAGTAFVAYLAKNFLSDSQGKVFGKIG